MATANSCRNSSCSQPNPTNGSAAHSKTTRPFLIGVSGGPASGKSTVCDVIMTQLGQDCVSDDLRHVALVRQDSFYRELSPEEHRRATRGQYNFDHPDAFDADLMMTSLADIKAGRQVELPTWDHVTHTRPDKTEKVVHSTDVVLVEGILVFYFPQIRDMLGMRLFVDTDPDTRLSRRVLKDVEERGRDIEQVLTQYTELVKPAFEQFCLPTKKYADVIIPRGADNAVAVDLIVKHIKELMRPDQPSRSKKVGGSPSNKTRSLSCFSP